MARAQSLDHLQAFRFRLVDTGGTLQSSQLVLNETIEGQKVGFQSISGLSIAADPEEIREGNWPFPHHILLRGTVGTITLRRGVISKDSDFFLWAVAALFGKQLVRRDLRLDIMARSDVPAEEGAVIEEVVGKSYLLHGCIPVNFQAFGDLDANSAEVLVAELEIQPEYFEELAVSG